MRITHPPTPTHPPTHPPTHTHIRGVYYRQKEIFSEKTLCPLPPWILHPRSESGALWPPPPPRVSSTGALIVLFLGAQPFALVHWFPPVHTPKRQKSWGLPYRAVWAPSADACGRASGPAKGQQSPKRTDDPKPSTPCSANTERGMRKPHIHINTNARKRDLDSSANRRSSCAGMGSGESTAR